MKGKNFIANPNCTTAILAMPLYPIYKKYGLKKVIVSTYQAASGAGYEGMSELEESTKAKLEGNTFIPKIFQYPLAFNIIPRIDVPQENGYTKEEMKVTWETRKIFGDNDIALSCTAVRIPVYRAHSESVTIETVKPVRPEEVRELLRSSPGVEVIDDLENNKYPMPQTATGKFDVEVGRIRRNEVFGEYGLDFFVSGDQLLRGAALNAVCIAEVKLRE
jgi:aspartate-semialdehyde dehydrogenase